MIKRKRWIPLLAISVSLAGCYYVFNSRSYDKNTLDSLTIENVEALTQRETGIIYPDNPPLDDPRIGWESHHVACTRSALINGVITLVPNGQIRGYSSMKLYGSKTIHEHDCTFYCPENTQF